MQRPAPKSRATVTRGALRHGWLLALPSALVLMNALATRPAARQPRPEDPFKLDQQTLVVDGNLEVGGSVLLARGSARESAFKEAEDTLGRLERELAAFQERLEQSRARLEAIKTRQADQPRLVVIRPGQRYSLTPEDRQKEIVPWLSPRELTYQLVHYMRLPASSRLRLSADQQFCEPDAEGRDVRLLLIKRRPTK